MQQSAPRAFRLWILLACALPAFLGCRAFRTATGQMPAAVDAPPAGLAAVPLTPEEVEATLDGADVAVQAGRCAEALELLDVLGAAPQVLSEEQAARADTLRGRARSILHEQELAAAQGRPLQPAVDAAAGDAPLAAVEAAAGDGPLAAGDLLAEAERLWNERKYNQAAACVNSLDPRREQLPEADRLLYDELRRVVQLTSQQVRPLSDPDRARRAHEHLEAGLQARDAGDYVSASAHLHMAGLFDTSLGAAADRKLRRALDQVDGALQDARAEIMRARGWLATGRIDEARKALEAVRGRGIRMGPLSEELDRLLAEAAEAAALHEKEAAEERKAQAAALLEQAAAAGERGEFERAAGPLADLKALEADLAPEARTRYEALCDAVEKATGVRPGLSAEEARALAERELEAGLEAYDAGRYADAWPHLDKAARLSAHLGWRSNRKLRAARERVDETLGKLRGLCRTGSHLYEARDYAGARKALEEVRDSSVQIGQPEQDDVARLLASIRQKEEEEREVQRAEATRLLGEARDLAAKEEYARAVTILTDLAGRAEWLTPEQRKEHEALLSAAQKAEVRASAERHMQEATRLAEEAAQLLGTRSFVRERLDACEAALARQDFDAADAGLAAATAVLEGADPKHRAALAPLGDQVRLKSEVVKAARQRHAHLADVARQLDELAAGAARQSETNLLTAEAMVREMLRLAHVEGVHLSDQQAAVRDAVMEGVQEAYRIDRWLRPTEYGRLTAMADQYVQAGEPGKAVWALALVADAPADMVDDEGYRGRAVEKLTAARKEADKQAAAAADLAETCAACRASLAAGDLPAAVNGAAGVLRTAQEKALSGQPLIKTLEAVVTLLGTDVPQAMAETPPELRRHVAQRLALARMAIAVQLAEAYVRAGSPELAEPYLKVLTTAAGAEAAVAEWARTQTAALSRQKGDAEDARMAEVARDSEQAEKLAARLLQLAQAGDVAQAEAVRTELADLRVALEVRKARAAAGRGDYEQAVRLIEGAPVGGASERVLTEVYKPAGDELRRARDVAAGLAGAEAALDACDVARAAELLTALPGAEALPEPDQRRRQALAAVVESALVLRERHLALSAQAEQELAKARVALAAARQRAEAWTSYRDEMTAFLTGRQAASGPLRTVIGRPAGLTEPELAEVSGIVDVLLAEEQKRAVAEAKELLTRAVLAYNAADYLAAADALAGVKAHAGFPLSEDLQASAKSVEDAVKEKEQEARDLYDQAVAALQAGDAERVRQILEEPKDRYAKTAAYRGRQ